MIRKTCTVASIVCVLILHSVAQGWCPPTTSPQPEFTPMAYEEGDSIIETSDNGTETVFVHSYTSTKFGTAKLRFMMRLGTSPCSSWNVVRVIDTGSSLVRQTCVGALPFDLESDGNNNLVFVYAIDPPGSDGSDIYVTTSSNGGWSWTTPAPLFPDHASDPYFDLHPRIATDRNGNWVVVVSNMSTAPNYIDYAVSTNNGLSWSARNSFNSDHIDTRFPDIDCSNNLWVVGYQAYDEGYSYPCDPSSFGYGIGLMSWNGLPTPVPQQTDFKPGTSVSPSCLDIAMRPRVVASGNKVLCAWVDSAFGNNCLGSYKAVI